MVIKKNNEILFDEIDLHDSYFGSFYYDYLNDTISIKVIDEHKKIHTLIFKDVIFFQCQNFKIQIEGKYIISFKQYNVLPMMEVSIQQDQKETKNQYYGLAKDAQDYIGACLLFNSADKWLFLCKEIEFI